MIALAEKKLPILMRHFNWVTLLLCTVFLIPCVLAVIVFISGITTALEVRGLCPNGEYCTISTTNLDIQDIIDPIIIDIDQETLQKMGLLGYEGYEQFYTSGIINVTDMYGNRLSLFMEIEYIDEDINSDESDNIHLDYIYEYISSAEFQLDFEISEI